MSVFLLLVCLAFQAEIVFAAIPDSVIAAFKVHRKIHTEKVVLYNYYPLGSRASGHSLVLSENCADLEPFAKSFLIWAESISSDSDSDSVKAVPKCECRHSVCAMEMAEVFPNVFGKKLLRNMACNGPNCANTALISSGFLDASQIRYSSLNEFRFYIDTYCTEVPISDRRTNDILVWSHHPSVFATHIAVYIDHDIAFSKSGPPKKAHYALEDWAVKFSGVAGKTSVLRCSTESLFPKARHLGLTKLEISYTELVAFDVLPGLKALTPLPRGDSLKRLSPLLASHARLGEYSKLR